MIAKRKLIPLENLTVNQTLWKRLEDSATTDKQRAEIVKDICLLEAALATDKIVISLDDNTARKFFSQAAQQIQDIEEVIWVNPDCEDEQPIIWLEQSAPYEAKRTLGKYQS
jgi:superfamily I DNA and RNA helicase